MLKSLVGSVVITLGLQFAPPARAQSEAAQFQVAAPEHRNSNRLGVTVREQAGGFELVVHGVWDTPDHRSSGPVTDLDIGSRAHLTKPKAARTGVPISFRRAAFLAHVLAAESRFSLPAGLLDALVWTESRYNPFAVSKAGAAGLGQLMPGTASDMGVANRFDPQENLMGSARYLRRMLDKFGAVYLALAAYNAGPGAVERAGGVPLNSETPGYVKEVLRLWRFD